MSAASQRDELSDVISVALDGKEQLTIGEIADALLAAGWTRATDNPTDDVIEVVFDGPPAHISGRFVEVENSRGESIHAGEWVEREDGYWALRIEPRRADSPTRSENEVKAEALREFADTLGVDIGDEDGDWWRGYRQAQREALHAAVRRADSLAPARAGVSDEEASEIARDLARQSKFYAANPREDARPDDEE